MSGIWVPGCGFLQATKEFEAEITKSKDETVAKVEGQQDESSPTESGTITSTPIANPPKSEKESTKRVVES